MVRRAMVSELAVGDINAAADRSELRRNCGGIVEEIFTQVDSVSSNSGWSGVVTRGCWAIVATGRV